MTAEWAEWLTVAWSKIPLARDSFLLLMTRTMNESMVGKAGRMIQKRRKQGWAMVEESCSLWTLLLVTKLEK